MPNMTTIPAGWTMQNGQWVQQPTKKKTTQDIINEATTVAKKAAQVAGLPAYDPTKPYAATITPTSAPGVSTTPETSPLAGVVSGKTEPTPKSKLAADLATASATATAFDPVARYKAMMEERGLGEKGEVLTGYEKQEAETLNLLDQLEEDITQRTGGYLVSEAERRRITAAEQTPLMKQLGVAQRGKQALAGEYERGVGEVERMLGLEAEAAGMPLERIKQEAAILNLLKDEKEVELDVFTDENNDRIATVWNQETGKTRQINLGKVAVKEETGEYKPPTSYQEWSLAGGQEGTGKSYSEWLQKEETENPGDYSDLELRKLREAGINSTDIKKADEFLYGETEITDQDIQDTKDDIETQYYDMGISKDDIKKQITSKVDDISVQKQLFEFVDKLPAKTPGWLPETIFGKKLWRTAND